MIRRLSGHAATILSGDVGARFLGFGPLHTYTHVPTVNTPEARFHMRFATQQALKPVTEKSHFLQGRASTIVFPRQAEEIRLPSPIPRQPSGLLLFPAVSPQRIPPNRAAP